MEQRREVTSRVKNEYRYLLHEYQLCKEDLLIIYQVNLQTLCVTSQYKPILINKTCSGKIVTLS